MAKGSNAKLEVVKKLQSAFGDNYIGEFDKKYYLWADDGGEMVQIAITMTCPKVPIEVGEAYGSASENTDSNGDWSWDSDDSPKKFEPVMISEDEKKNLEDLMKQLGL